MMKSKFKNKSKPPANGDVIGASGAVAVFRGAGPRTTINWWGPFYPILVKYTLILREKLGILSLVGTKSGGKSYLRVKARGPHKLIWGPKMLKWDQIIIIRQEN